MSYFGEVELARSTAIGEIVLAHHRSRSCLEVHRHPQPYISVCLDGGYLEDFGTGVDQVSRGDLFIHPAHEAHANDMDGRGATILNLQVSLSIQRLYDVAGAHGARVRTRCSNESLRRVEELLTARTRRPLLFELVGVADILLPELDSRMRPGAKHDPKLERAAAAIDADREHSWTLGELAAIAGYHRVYFAGKFRAEFGCPPGEYVRRSRMREALRLICLEGASATDAAHASGFFDSAHMTNSFRKAAGLKPGSLKRQTNPRKP